MKIRYLLVVIFMLLLTACTNKHSINDISQIKDNNLSTKLINSNPNRDNGEANIYETDIGNNSLDLNELDKDEEKLFSLICEYISNDWILINANGDEIVKGDLNQDGIDDIVCGIEETTTKDRALTILIGMTDGKYEQAVFANSSIRRSDEGGSMGEPFMGLTIDRGSILIHHYGGSAWRWSDTYRFRYQDDNWYLIGATEDWFHAVSDSGRLYEDFNLLTGDYIKIETDEYGVEIRVNENRGVKDLIILEEFIVGGDRKY